MWQTAVPCFQTVFDFLGNGQQGRGGVAHGQHRAGVFLRGLVHGSYGAGGASFFGGSRHGGVGHKAHGLPAQLGKARLGDARQRHVGIGDDGHALVHGGNACCHRSGGKVQVLRVVEIGRSMDDPLDDRRILRRDLQPTLGQFLGDDAHAGALNIGGQVMLRGHVRSSFGPVSPMAA